MAVEHRVIHARDFVRMNIRGELDFEESNRALAKLFDMLDPPGHYEVLIDARGIDDVMSPDELHQIARKFKEHRHSFRSKIAILKDIHDDATKAKFLRLAADTMQYRLEVFYDYEKAIEWINEGDGVGTTA